MRPTAAKIRAAIFDRLQSDVQGMRVLDLFAGSGALAFEALSRGAAEADLVDCHPALVRHLRNQIQVLELHGSARVHRADARRFVERPSVRPFDLVLLDPPYASANCIPGLLEDLVGGGWFAPGAVVVCERGRAGTPSGSLPPALHLEKSREFGQTQVEFLRFQPSQP